MTGPSEQAARHRQRRGVVQAEHGRAGAVQPGGAGGDDLREQTHAVHDGDAARRLGTAAHLRRQERQRSREPGAKHGHLKYRFTPVGADFLKLREGGL